MFRAISTKYLGPTNSRGSRVKAIARKREWHAEEISLTDNWDHAGGIEDNHARVAKLLAAKMDWAGFYVGGSTDDGFVFVNCGDVPLARRWAGVDSPHREFGVENRDWFYIAPREA